MNLFRKLAYCGSLITCVLNFTSAHAGFDDLRADLNFSYSNLLQGQCEEKNKNDCHEADVLGSEGKHLSEDIKEVIDRSAEDHFFATARADQINYLKCDREQIKAMKKGDEKSLKFQKLVLTDLSEKLPELRELYKKTNQLKSERDDLNAQVQIVTVSMGRGFVTEAEVNRKILELKSKAAKSNLVYQKEVAKYNILFSSIWRSDNPIMQKYIMRQIQSNRAPEDLLKESLVVTKDSIYKRSMKNPTFSFQTQVLDKIEDQAQKDLKILQKKGELDFSTKRMLVEESDWYKHFSEKPDLQNAQLMCVLDKRYVSGDEAVKTTAEILSLAAGGLGIASKIFTASKYARLMSSGVSRTVLTTSNTLSTASLYLGVPLVATQVKKACLEDKPNQVYRSVKTCSASDVENFQEIESHRVDQDNCAVAVAMAGLLTTPLTIKYIEKFKKIKAAKNASKNEAYLKAQATATKEDSTAHLISRLSPHIQKDPKIKDILELRVTSDNAGDVKYILEKSEGAIDSPAKLNYILDQVSGLSSYTPKQKEKVFKNIILSLDKKTSQGLTIKVAEYRQKQFERDLIKAEEKIKSTHPELDDLASKRLALTETITRRENRLQMSRSCTARTVNSSSLKAGSIFTTANIALGSGSAILMYLNAHWNDVKNTEWGARLGYEIFLAGFTSFLGGKIASNQSTGFVRKVVDGNVVNFKISLMDSSAYTVFRATFDEIYGKDEGAKEFNRIASSPHFKEDMKKLEDYINNKGRVEEFVDKMGDFSNNMIRMATGKNQIEDITVEELQKLDKDALKNPIIMERMMDTIEDQIYSEQLKGNTYGSNMLDRLAFDTEWGLTAIPRGVLVGMITYQAVCRNIDNPTKAIAAFIAIQGTNKGASNYFYYKKKAKDIGQ